MTLIKWLENRNIYYKILYLAYAIISITFLREIPYLTTIYSLVMVAVSFIYFLVFFIKGYYFKMSKLRYLLIVFLLLQCSSFFISDNFISDIIRLVFNGIFFLVISISTSDNKTIDIIKIYRWFLYFVFPIVITSILTYFFKIKFTINNNVYGRLDNYDSGDKILKGITVNINTLGILCALMCIFSIHIILTSYKSNKGKLFLYCSLLIGLLTLLITEARGAIMMLIVYILLIYIFQIKSKKKVIAIFSFGTLLSGILLCVILQNINMDNLSSGRTLLWKTALGVIKDNELWGVGTTAFVNVVKESSSVYLPGIELGGLHNIFIQIATANGVIALVTFLLFLILILGYGIVYSKGDKTRISLLSILISILTLNLFESGLIYIMSFIAIIFWITIGEFFKLIKLE